MEVDKLRNIHVETRSEEGMIRVMLSEDWGDIYQTIKSNLDKIGVLSLEIEQLRELADRIMGYLTVELGPVSVRLYILALTLYVIGKRVAITTYEVTSSISAINSGAVNDSPMNKSTYTVEPLE